MCRSSRFSRSSPGCPRRRLGRAFQPWPDLALLLALLSAVFLVQAAQASATLTVEQLRRMPNLTPERFMTYFRDFRFKLGDKRQAPDTFLATKTGDCEDFACLAAEIFKERKYTTKLIAVFMDGQTHVVCYVKEVQGYLDYNRRQESCPVQPSSGKLADVANNVATYFRTRWRYASEFTYQAGSPQFGEIVFH